MNDAPKSRQIRPALSRSPRKCFRLEKLEERIAPAKWGKRPGTLYCGCHGPGACM